jgi:trehalose utilization protein
LQPGHETFPIYHNPHVQKVITNAVKWAKPEIKVNSLDCPQMEALEKIGPR